MFYNNSKQRFNSAPLVVYPHRLFTSDLTLYSQWCSLWQRATPSLKETHYYPHWKWSVFVAALLPCISCFRRKRSVLIYSTLRGRLPPSPLSCDWSYSCSLKPSQFKHLPAGRLHPLATVYQLIQLCLGPVWTELRPQGRPKFPVARFLCLPYPQKHFLVFVLFVFLFCIFSIHFNRVFVLYCWLVSKHCPSRENMDAKMITWATEMFNIREEHLHH